MVDGLEILKSEVESNLKKMNEAAGSKQAVTDMTIALEDYGIDKQAEKSLMNFMILMVHQKSSKL